MIIGGASIPRVSWTCAPRGSVVVIINVIRAVAANTERVEARGTRGGSDPGAVGARAAHRRHGWRKPRVSEARAPPRMRVLEVVLAQVIVQLVSAPADGAAGVTPTAGAGELVSLRVSAGAGARVPGPESPLPARVAAAAREVGAGAGPGKGSGRVEAVHFVHYVGGCIILTLE